MQSNDKKFQITIPATLEKGEGDTWRVYGLASTPNTDQQGEKIDLKGLDLSPIDEGKGLFNFDHKKGPENLVGIIDTYKKSDNGLYLGGYLFQNHDRAKSLYQIMSSLNKSDRGRMGMSVEGVIKERKGKDGKIIAKAQIHSCALTMNPVNTDTYINLVKSLTEVSFDNGELTEDVIPSILPSEPQGTFINEVKALSFTTDQVVALLTKALSVGGEYASSKPGDLSGGAALAQEDLDSKKKKMNVTEDNGSMVDKSKVCKKCEGVCKCMKSLKKGDSALYKSMILDALESLHKLYPEVPKSAIWEVFKERLNQKFPDQGPDDKQSI